VQRRSGVHAELFPATERDRRAQHHQAPRAPVEAGTRPDLAPGVSRDEILKVLGQRGGLCERSRDVIAAEHLAAYLQADFAACCIIHGDVRSENRASRR
jgi:hypothetical protein